MINDLRNIFANKEIDLVFHLEKAIENDEFEIYYQPIIHTISGSLCGFEALVRWHHPTLGFLAPPQFLISLEETRQIYHLDIHVIEKVCRRYAEQVQAGKPVVPVSVNLSRVDFVSTESAISDDAQLMHNTISRFRSAGYQVWMDDFGSGYSSLNTLKDYKFDEIKTDHHNIATDEVHELRKTISQYASFGVHESDRESYLRFMDPAGYSIDFSDSVMLTFLRRLSIKRFTMTENTNVIATAISISEKVSFDSK